jgi:hypothetical protein
MKLLNIYCLTSDNVIFYIGRTIQDIDTRFKRHIQDTKYAIKHNYFLSMKEQYIQKSLNGNKEISIKLIESCLLDESEFGDLEDYWIEQFKQWGFNLTNSITSKWENKFIKSVLSKSVYQYDLMGNYINNYSSISEACRLLGIKVSNSSNITRAANSNKSCFGYKWSWYKSKKLEQYSINKNTLPLKCFDINGNLINIFNSAREAAKYLNISYKHISSVARGNKDHVSYYRFIYDNEENKFINKLSPYKKKLSSKSKIIYQYNLDGTFISSWDSAVLAARSINGNPSNINAVCNPNMKEISYKGFLWSYDKVENLVYNPKINQYK